MFGPGDPIPSFHARSSGNPRYSFDSVAGRYVVVTFIAGGRMPGAAEFLAEAAADQRFLDDRFASLFVVSNDAQDDGRGPLQDRLPGIRMFRDDDRALARLFGCLHPGAAGNDCITLTTWVLDPGLRVLKVLPVENLATHFDQIRNTLEGLDSPAQDTGSWAPVLLVPNLLEPEFC